MSESVERSISRFPVPDLADLPDDIRQRIEVVSDKSGFIPNVFLVLAHRPDEFRAFMAYHDALMERDSGLTKGERELIVVATSARNHCLYCVVAHGAIARIRMKNPRVADQVAMDPNKAELTQRQRAMLAFAVKVAERSHELVDADYEELRQHGFSDDDIWDIGAIASFSPCPTAWPTSRRCGRTTSSTPWAAEARQSFLLRRDADEPTLFTSASPGVHLKARWRSPRSELGDHRGNLRFTTCLGVMGNVPNGRERRRGRGTETGVDV